MKIERKLLKDGNIWNVIKNDKDKILFQFQSYGFISDFLLINRFQVRTNIKFIK